MAASTEASPPNDSPVDEDADRTGDDKVATIHVAVDASLADREPLTRLVRSVAAHTSRPAEIVVVSRDLVTVEDLAEPERSVSVCLVRTDGLGKDLRRGDGRSATDRDVDLLALPEVLDIRRPTRQRAVASIGAATSRLAELLGRELWPRRPWWANAHRAGSY